MKPLLLVPATCALLALLAVAPLTARSATRAAPVPGVNDTCLMCHGDKDAKGAAGNSIAVDADRFKGSVHGELQLKCTDCHADVSADKLPAPREAEAGQLRDLPRQAVKEYATTVHGKARKGGNNVAATCTDCHGTHDILTVEGSRIAHQSREHRSDVLAMPRQRRRSVGQGKLPGGNIASKFHDSIHGKALPGRSASLGPDLHQLPRRAQHPAPRATPRAGRAAPTSPTPAAACHKRERAAFLEGQHGKLRQDGNLAAPGCTDCHTAHAIQQHEVGAVPDRRDRGVRHLPRRNT